MSDENNKQLAAIAHPQTEQLVECVQMSSRLRMIKGDDVMMCCPLSAISLTCVIISIIYSFYDFHYVDIPITILSL